MWWYFWLFNMKSLILSVTQILRMNKVRCKFSGFYSTHAAHWLSLFCRFRNKLSLSTKRAWRWWNQSTWSVAQIRLKGIFTSSCWPLTCIFVSLGREPWGLQTHRLLKKVLVQGKSARMFLNVLKGTGELRRPPAAWARQSALRHVDGPAERTWCIHCKVVHVARGGGVLSQLGRTITKTKRGAISVQR